MPRHTVRMLATIGACSALAFALPTGSGAEELNTPHITVPRVNVPKPHITVPTVNNNVSTVNTGSTVNLRHHRLSTRTNARANLNKLGGSQGNGTTTAKTPFVGPTDTGGSAGAKVIIESVGGSGTPTQVQQQNGAAAAAAAAIGAASSGAGSLGQTTSPANTLPASVGPNRDGGIDLGALNPAQVVKINPGSIAPPYGTTAYYNYLTGGGENAAYASDMSALEAAACPGKDPNLFNCVSTPKPTAAVTALLDFQAEINYLLFLLGLTQDTSFTGFSFTPQETALIEQAISQCIASPSTCAATIANLNAELAAMGVPATFTPNPNSGESGTVVIFYTPAQIDGGSIFSIEATGAIAFGATLSAQVATAQQTIAAAP